MDINDDEELRTFETRLTFIRDIFANKYTEYDIFKSSVEHKLKKSYEQYLEDLERSMELLNSKDPLKVLNRAGKEN